MLGALPAEILDLVALESNETSLVHLCRTTKRLQTVAERLLYRKVHLSDLHHSVIFFQTVTARPNLALATRDFFFNLSCVDCIFVAFWNLFSRALCAMSNLTALHFAGANLSDIIFRDNTHPNLVRFTSVDYITPEVSSFLTRHPSLKQVFIGEGSTCLHTLLPPSALPSLDTLIGSIHEMGGILPGRHVTHLILTWFIPFSDANTYKIIKQLTRGASPVRTFNCTTFEIAYTRHAIVRAIAQYLPHLHILKMANLTLGSRLVLDDVVRYSFL
ncbi:hypothetical protein BU17DRAFT_46250 [Hysterangium stoloniferum]|nr:hypothetical protein BU17DRAFT_46250 [Hysterangium stoloniferum]